MCIYLFVLFFAIFPQGGYFVVSQDYPDYSQSYSALPSTIKIGGLFDSSDSAEEAAFKHAVERVNADYSVLPRSRLGTLIEKIPPIGDSFYASNKVCEMMREGIGAIFGPQSAEAASHVQSICDAYEIPHIETKWDFRLRQDNYLINLYPHPGALNKAYNDLVEVWSWDKYVILYENQDGLFRLQDLIRASEPPKRKVILKQLPPGDDFRTVLKDIVKDPELKKIIIDCENSKIPSVLKQAQQVGLMTYEYSYLITSLDLHTMSLEDFKYGDLNITAFRMVDPSRPEVQSVIQEWNAQHFSQGGLEIITEQNDIGISPIPLTTEMALIYDAVLLFGKALHTLDSSQRIEIKPLSCESSEMWQHGYSIINYMKMVQLQGLTGLIQFNTTGFRTDINLDVIQLSQNGLVKIGTWDSKYHSKFNWTKTEEKFLSDEHLGDEASSLRNKTLIATTIMNAPFCMLTRSQVPLKGNARYEGYNIELLHELSQKLGFDYVVKIVDDGAYGSFNNKSKKWNGMISEVMDGVADLAIGDITINKDRQQAVAFSHPFMNLGISILFTTPKAKPPSLFSFMSPFGLDVWLYMCFAFFGVSFILFILARITPYEWDNPYPCIEEPEFLENSFSLHNSFWFTIGSIMQQGSDVAPKISAIEWSVAYPCKDNSSSSVLFVNDLTFFNVLWITMASFLRQKPSIWPKAVSTRIIAGTWWFFTLIMVSSYTANLATFLIVQDLDESIKSLDDLPKQTKVQYGCVSTGSTASFFRDSPFESKRKIWDNMMKMKPSPFEKSNKDGMKRVIENPGKFAFFMESTVIEYNIERTCGLAQVGGFLDSKGYGIALKKGSKYRQAFNSGILNLQETGILDALKRKWWKEERKDGPSCDEGTDAEVKPLALANVGGVFVVLVMGCGISVVLACAEFLWKYRSIELNEGETLIGEMKAELAFALKLSGDSKPVKKRGSSSGGSRSNNHEPSIESGGRFQTEDPYGFPLNKKSSKESFK